MKEQLRHKVEETLNSLDDLQRAEANPFLYGRIRNRLESYKEVISKPIAWRMAIALGIVALVNIISILHFSKDHQKNNGVELVATEYSISLPQTY